MPMRAGRACAASCTVLTRSFPMATPNSLTPCSAPHNQVGHDRKRGVRCRVADRQILRAQRAAGPGAAAERNRELDLTGGPVRVLGEDHARPGTGATQGVAHGSSIWSLSRVRSVEPRSVLTLDQIDLSDPDVLDAARGRSAKAPSNSCAGSIPWPSSRNPPSPGNWHTSCPRARATAP